MSIYDSQTGKSDLAVDDLSMFQRGKTASELFNSGSGFTPTAAQLAAMNSGITSADVAQINTNKNNIAKLISEINTITISDLTWTESGQGMYYSTEIPLESIKTILGWCFVEINGLRPENWLLVSQNTTGLGKFRLLAGSNSFYAGAVVSIRLYGTTDELT